jgi:hypothetical protein
MQDIRLVRFYKPRFVTSTEGVVEQKDYTRNEIQILVKTENGEEWKTLPIVDIPE